MNQSFLIENLKFQRNNALDALAMSASENAELRAEVARLSALNTQLTQQAEEFKKQPQEAAS